jgi:drug/metabolite transporter (DMT)-like permease
VAFDLKDKTSQYFILFMLAATWGSSFILMKLGLRSFTPIEVALLRVSISFIVLSPFVLYHIRTIPKDRWKWLAAAGFLGNGVPAFMFALGLSRINSSLGGIINATAPLFTMIVGSIFFSMKFGKHSVWGVFIGLIGTVYLIVFGGRGKGDTDVLYVLFPLIGSLCYGFSSNIIKLKLKELKPIVVTGAALMTQAPLTILFVFILGIPEKALSTSLNTESFLYITLLAIMGTSLAVLVFNYLIKHTTVLFAASVTYLVPMFAMAIGFFAGETISIHYFIGMGIIIFGVWLTSRG